jgi:2-C-methyl-D-erythritol 2,4-cyclodiphosphate synthase
MAAEGYRLGNLDATILAQVPRLAPHQPAMRKRLAEILDADEARVNIKVTSTDGLGAIGREEGIGAEAVVLLFAQEGDGLA